MPYRRHFIRLLTLLLLYITSAPGWNTGLLAQANTDTAAHQDKASGPWLRKSTLIPVPLVFYTPETKFGFGAAAFYAFRFHGQPDSLRPSQATLSFTYTTLNQILIYFPFQLFWSREKWQLKGELGYYRYVYQFFGLGNSTLAADRESFDAILPRVRLNALRKVGQYQYLGIKYSYDQFEMTRLTSGGILETQPISGREGGVISGAGLLWNVDSRDNLFFPAKGFLAELEVFASDAMLGSDYDFTRVRLDAAGYFSRSEKRVLALNALLVSSHGDVPFQDLAMIGGPKKMRGFFEGRFRDKSLWMLQAEYRVALPWRFGVAVFGGMGSVAPRFDALPDQRVHLTYGAGARYRLSKKDPIHLRVDVAFNEEGYWFPYLTVLEAF